MARYNLLISTVNTTLKVYYVLIWDVKQVGAACNIKGNQVQNARKKERVGAGCKVENQVIL
jgi:hypothetical protein